MAPNKVERIVCSAWSSVPVILVWTVISVGGCDRPPNNNASPPPHSTMNGRSSAPDPAPSTQPTATTSGYASLAANLADPFLTAREHGALKKELAQLFAEANVKIVRYQSTHTADPMLRRIAQEAADSGLAMVQSHQALDALEQDDGFSSFLIGALGLYLGDPTTIITEASGVLANGDAKQQERIKWAAAFNRSRAAQLMLPEAAKAYCGLARTSKQLVGIDFDESFAGSADHDQIALTNASGGPLTNCTVLVELRGRDGDVRQNVHFVPLWEEDGARFARYGIGIESNSGVYGRRTVYGVQEVRVSVWADETSQESIVYRYVGTERDKDVKAELDGKMKVMYRYNQYPFFGNGPEVLLVLTEVPAIPAHRLTLTFLPDAQASNVKPVSLHWEQKEWNKDEQRTVSLGSNLKFDPEAMHIKIAFADIGYEYTREVVIKKN
jgi:hypothetical protein